MTLKNKFYGGFFTLVGVFGLLFFLGFISTRSLEARNAGSEKNLLLVDSNSEQKHFTLIALSPLKIEDEVIGTVAVYDDPTTQRPEDYVEFYDKSGKILAYVWFDQFGIERVAMDRGLLGEGHTPEGVFVMIIDGAAV